MTLRQAWIPFVFVILVIGVVSTVGAEASLYKSPNQVPFVRESSQAGVVLRVAVNATELRPGQRLGIVTSLFNTLSVPNSVMTADNWTINGFPVSIWPGCFFSLPVEFTVVKGNLSLAQVEALGNGTAAGYICMEATSVDHVIFQPESSNVTLVGTYCGGVCSPDQVSGPFNLVSNFTVDGYWNYPVSSNDSRFIYSPYDGGITFRYPEVGPVSAYSFDQGVYTLVVADEWGGTVLTNFSVVGGDQACAPATGVQGLPTPTSPWFTAGVNYSGPWEATAVVHTDAASVSDFCYQGTGPGYFEYQNPDLGNGSFIIVTATKLDSGTDVLHLAVNGVTNSTSTPFGTATVTAPVTASETG